MNTTVATLNMIISQVKDTGISEATIDTISKHFCKPPEPWAFEIHKGIHRILERREKMVCTHLKFFSKLPQGRSVEMFRVQAIYSENKYLLLPILEKYHEKNSRSRFSEEYLQIISFIYSTVKPIFQYLKS